MKEHIQIQAWRGAMEVNSMDILQAVQWMQNLTMMGNMCTSVKMLK